MYNIIYVFFVSMTSAWKVGVISDVHMKLAYDPTTSKNGCGSLAEDEGFLELNKDPIALLGRVGCDAPKELVEMML